MIRAPTDLKSAFVSLRRTIGGTRPNRPRESPEEAIVFSELRIEG